MLLGNDEIAAVVGDDRESVMCVDVARLLLEKLLVSRYACLGPATLDIGPREANLIGGGRCGR